MNQEEQIKFVNDLSMGLALHIATLIDEGKIPAEWDGHELRLLLAEFALGSASISELRKEPKGKRARDYRNHVLTKL